MYGMMTRPGWFSAVCTPRTNKLSAALITQRSKQKQASTAKKGSQSWIPLVLAGVEGAGGSTVVEGARVPTAVVVGAGVSTTTAVVGSGVFFSATAVVGAGVFFAMMGVGVSATTAVVGAGVSSSVGVSCAGGINNV